MKACFLYYQGFCQLVHREATALKRAGFDVDIICLKNYRGERIFEKYDGLNIYKIQSRQNAEKTVFVYILKLLLFLVKSALLITFLTLIKRYHVIHVTSPPDIAVFTTIIPKMLGSKVILDIHDIGPELFMRKLNVSEKHPVITFLKYLEKLSARYADHVITVTDIWRDRLVGRSVSESKCSVILNVPDQKMFRFNSRKAVSDTETFNLYYHGSLEEHFGVDTMLEAMPLIKKQVDKAVLHIYAVKKGRMNDYLVSYTKDNNMSDYVKFHDGVMFDELPGILANADVGIVPTKNSIFADEAVSMKSLEYLFLGIPIVISKTTAHSYYYDESMVRFFKPCNSIDLAEAVTDLYVNREKTKGLVAGSTKFIEQYGWEKTGNVYRKIVTDLAATV